MNGSRAYSCIVISDSDSEDVTPGVLTFKDAHVFHQHFNGLALLDNYAFMTPKVRPSTKTTKVTLMCCRTDENGKPCLYRVAATRLKDAHECTHIKIDPKNTGHNHTLVAPSAEQQELVDLAELQRECDRPGYQNPEVPPRYRSYNSPEDMLQRLSKWAHARTGFVFKAGHRWESKKEYNMHFLCALPGCKYRILGSKAKEPHARWSVAAGQSAKHIKHNHGIIYDPTPEEEAIINRAIVRHDLPPVEGEYATFHDLHQALNEWATDESFAFKPGRSRLSESKLKVVDLHCCLKRSSGQMCSYRIVARESANGEWAISSPREARKHNHAEGPEYVAEQKSQIAIAETRRIIQRPDYAPAHLPKRGGSYESREAVLQYLNRFAFENNFAFIILRSHVDDSGLETAVFSCSMHINTPRHIAAHYNTCESGTNCPYRVIGRERIDESWTVGYTYDLDMDHNHGPLRPRVLPPHRKLTDQQKELVKRFAERGKTAGEIVAELGALQDQIGKTHALAKDISNFLYREKKKALVEQSYLQ